MADPLFTVLQVSDLHVGEIDPTTGDARINAATRQLFSNCGWFDGVLGHHSRGLEDLSAFYRKHRPSWGSPFRVVVSGDLTRVGGGAEFDNAAAFLGAQLQLPAGKVGFGWPRWARYAIPGNHDKWSGKPVVWGGPHPRLAHYFPAGSLPYRQPANQPYALANGWTLRFVGIDTDADVSPYRLKRLRAVGSFQKQLAAAAPLLGPAPPREVRVLVLHHSWHRRGLLLSIDRGSRAALEKFLQVHGIRILMTGHTHDPLLQQFVPRNGAATLECRCGTTTQVDQVPFAWRTAWGVFPVRNWPENTLLVHRLYADPAGLRWEVETFYRDPAHGFQTVGPRGRAALRL